MGRGGESFEKRRLEKQRQERRAAKRDRREARKGDDKGDDQAQAGGPTEADLMERFRVLSERHAEGVVGEAAYEAERHEIFLALGLEAPDGEPPGGGGEPG